jgi:chaperone modulatory protein CbpM
MLQAAGLGLLPLAISNEQAVYLQTKKGVDDAEMEPSKSPVVVEHDFNTYAVPHLPGGVAGCKIGAHAAGEFMNNSDFVLPAGAVPLLKQLEQPELWVFTSPAVARARQVARLQREFDVNLDAAALIADLMQEIGQLRAALSNR